MAPPKVIHPDFNYEKQKERKRERERASERDRARQKEAKYWFGSAPSALPGRKGPLWSGSGGLRTEAAGLRLPSRAGPSCTASDAPPRPRAATLSQPSASWKRSSPWSRPAGLPAATPRWHLLECGVNPGRLGPTGLGRQPRGTAKTPAAWVRLGGPEPSLFFFFFFFLSRLDDPPQPMTARRPPHPLPPISPERPMKRGRHTHTTNQRPASTSAPRGGPS